MWIGLMEKRVDMYNACAKECFCLLSGVCEKSVKVQRIYCSITPITLYMHAISEDCIAKPVFSGYKPSSVHYYMTRLHRFIEHNFRKLYKKFPSKHQAFINQTKAI